MMMTTMIMTMNTCNIQIFPEHQHSEISSKVFEKLKKNVPRSALFDHCVIPLSGLKASSCAHFNHSLWTTDGQNAFSDPRGDQRLSDTARQWISGLVKHAGALTALCSPTVNCFRRLRSLKTRKASWGIDDRSVIFRVKNLSHDATYVENRIASAPCNPYLALAATVAAG